MDVVVFLGPTLGRREAAAVLEASYLPPVSQGDVYRTAQAKPWAIGIVDGYFERVPAVWHKEILWAMSRGVHVFGAGSMGALRAAELTHFGMEGVGTTFEAFRDGRLEDDDEVTIAHAPAEGGYKPLSEAMVNIRATLARALLEGLIGADTRGRLEALAKGLYYPQRSFERIIRHGREQGLAKRELVALESWLPEGRVDQKRADAIAMLETIKARAGQVRSRKQVDFHFEHTDAWEQVARRSGRQVAAALPEALPAEVLLDELRLGHGTFGVAMEQALARCLALTEADREAPELDRALFRDAFDRFFGERGLVHPEQIRAWMTEQELDMDGLTLLIQREMKLHWVRKLYAPQAMAQLEDHLRASGDYPRLVRRARLKLEFLRAAGIENASLAAAGMAEEDLLEWFFVRRRGGQVPRDLDLYAQNQGFANRLSMAQTLLREYYFVTGTPDEGAEA